MLEVGSVVAGKLRIERILGQGGMGIVAEATHIQLDQRVAVKVMREQLAGDPSTVERFVREARAAAKLRSEHVCRVTDVGQLPSGAPYIVMELLAGTDLAAFVARGPLTVPTAVDYVLQASIAIAEAHAHGIVHRDLKPANLFLTKQVGGAPLVKVLDFGIAKASSENEFALTATEAMMGSPGYMSPEQLRSARDVDARTDIWALGVILYQLVSARVPFPATSVTELAVKVSMDPPDPLDVDPAFRATVFRCLEKAPADRFADVIALAAALAPFGSESARRSLAVIEQLAPRPRADELAATLAPIDPSAATAASSPPLPKAITTLQAAAGAGVAPAVREAPRRSRRWLMIAIAVAVAVLAVAGIFKKRILLAFVPESSSGPRSTAKLAELTTRFDVAIEQERCSEAIDLAGELYRAGEASANATAAKCIERQMRALTDPGAPGAAHTIVVQAEEMFATKQYLPARAVIDRVLAADANNEEARALGTKIACTEGAVSLARGYFDPMPDGKLRLDAIAHCAGRGIELSAPAARPTDDLVAAPVEPAKVAPKAPTAKKKDAVTLSADWKNEASYAQTTGDYRRALAIALAAAAKYPDEQHAAFIATGAYCALEDAPNARKWAAKLDAKHLETAQRFGCNDYNIDLKSK